MKINILYDGITNPSVLLGMIEPFVMAVYCKNKTNKTLNEINILYGGITNPSVLLSRIEPFVMAVYEKSTTKKNAKINNIHEQ